MMATDAFSWASRAPSVASDYGQQAFIPRPGDFSRTLSLARANSAVDMRQLTNALIEAREGTGEVRAALLSAAFRPRLPGLTKLVSKLSKEGSWRKALEVFEAVEDLGLRPDTALTNSAISACDKGGRWQKALEIFDRMDKLRLPRDAITYSATISALAKGKQWHAALQVFDHMQAAGVEADVVTCCSLINALERGGQWQLAEKLFLQMCTVQEDDIDGIQSLLSQGSLPGMLPVGAGGYGMMPQHGVVGPLTRSQTSPTSVLLALRGNGGIPNGVSSGTNLVSVNENAPTAPVDAGRSSSGSASIGILNAVANASGNGVQNETKVSEESPSGTDGLASAFARATSLSPAPSSLLAASGLEHENGVSANGSVPINPFAMASGSASLLSDRTALHGQFAGNSPDVLSGLAAQYTPVPPSRLQRSGSLRRDPNGPVQAAAAAHLRRAMSCFPELDVPDHHGLGGSISTGDGGTNNTGVTSMFTFSHAVRVAPNRVCCNALLAAYARAKPPQWQKAVHLLTAMWSGGPTLTPDAVSYNTVLKACANSFQLTRALEVYREMVTRGVVPNATTFNCLISSAADAGAAATLREVGMWLETAPHDVRAACMNAYTAGLVKVGAWEDALRAYRDMLAPGSPAHPTAATFNVVMSGYMHCGDYQAVRQTFEEMRAAGVSPTIVAYNTLLAALAAGGAWMDALDVLSAVLQASMEGVNANTATFNAVLSALASGASSAPPPQQAFIASRAVQLYQQMQSMGGPMPDVSTYNSLVSVLSSTGHVAQILAVHDLMMASGVIPDADTGGIILSAAMSSGQTARAVQLAHSLQLQGVSVDSTALTTLLGSCLGAGAWDLATQLCSAAQVGQGPAAAAAMYNFVLKSALAGGQYGVAMDVLTMMQSSGLEVDPATADKILGSDNIAGKPPMPSRQSSGSSSSGAASFTVNEQFQPQATVTFKGESVSRVDSLENMQPSFAATPATPVVSTSPGAHMSPTL